MSLHGARKATSDPISVYGALTLDDAGILSYTGPQSIYIPATAFINASVLVVACEAGTGVRVRSGDMHATALPSFVPTGQGGYFGWPVFLGEKEFFSLPKADGITLDIFGTGAVVTVAAL